MSQLVFAVVALGCSFAVVSSLLLVGALCVLRATAWFSYRPSARLAPAPVARRTQIRTPAHAGAL